MRRPAQENRSRSPSRKAVLEFISSGEYATALQTAFAELTTGSFRDMADGIIARHFGTTPLEVRKMRVQYDKINMAPVEPATTPVTTETESPAQLEKKPVFLKRLEKELLISEEDILYILGYLADRINNAEIDLDARASGIAYSINGGNESSTFKFSRKKAEASGHNLVTIQGKTKAVLLEAIRYYRNQGKL